MEGARRGARSVLKWFAPLYVVLIVVQVFLAGEGIFGLKNVKKLGDAKVLNAHRDLGFVLTEPLAILFLIAALLVWHPNTRVRTVTIVTPILTFVQVILANVGRWAGGLHPVNAFLVLALYGWLTHRLRQEEPVAAEAHAPVTVPAG